MPGKHTLTEDQARGFLARRGQTFGGLPAECGPYLVYQPPPGSPDAGEYRIYDGAAGRWIRTEETPAGGEGSAD
jgi:hypothetical protein